MVLGDFFVSQEVSPPPTPARMVSESLEIEKQRENETAEGTHARFGSESLKPLQKFSFFSARPLDFTSQVRRE